MILEMKLVEFLSVQGNTRTFLFTFSVIFMGKTSLETVSVIKSWYLTFVGISLGFFPGPHFDIPLCLLALI
jgi:hypothetical protein